MGSSCNPGAFDPDDEFFVITSEDAGDVHTRLHGYFISGGGVVCGKDFQEGMEVSDDGAFVYIEREGGRITIRQDYVGCYGLYLYEDDGFWAIGN